MSERTAEVVCSPILSCAFMLLTTAVLLCSGCATITRGTTEALVIESEPPGADVRISGYGADGVDCRTPCTVTVKRKKPLLISIQRDGYEPVTANVVPAVAGAGAAGMAGNVVLGGLIGASVDAWSGATKSLQPNPLKVSLVPLTRPATPATTAATPPN